MDFFIVERIDIIKNSETVEGNLCHIDVNSWFKANGVSPEDMNKIRQYIFEEWLTKKIQSAKNRIYSGYTLAVSYSSPNDKFIRLLEDKISFVLEIEKCKGILYP